MNFFQSTIQRAKSYFLESKGTEREEIKIAQPSTGHFATRDRAWGINDFLALLEDPDDVLRNRPEGYAALKRVLSDGHVWSCYQSRISGTLSREWELTEGNGSALFKLIESFMSEIDINEVIRGILQCVFYGYSPIEIMWKADTEMWIPTGLVAKPPDWFRYTWENELRFVGAMYSDGIAVPDFKFIVPTHYGSYENPYGEKTLSRCFWPSAFKHGSFKFWSLMVERFGMPWVLAKMPISATKDDKDLFADALKNARQDAVVVMTEDDEINLEYATGAVTAAPVYKGLIDSCNEEISKAIVGQTLTTGTGEGGGGSYALGTVHASVREDLIEHDGKIVREVFDKLFKWIGFANYPEQTPPKFSFYQEEDIQADRATRDETLNRQGVKFTKKYYMDTYNLQEDDFDISDQTDQNSIDGNFPPEQPAPESEFKEATDLLTEDEIATSGAILTEDLLKAMLAPVVDLVNKSDTFEEMQKGIFKIYPDLPKEEYQELIGRAMNFAAMTGYANAKKV